MKCNEFKQIQIFIYKTTELYTILNKYLTPADERGPHPHLRQPPHGRGQRPDPRLDEGGGPQTPPHEGGPGGGAAAEREWLPSGHHSFW